MLPLRYLGDIVTVATVYVLVNRSFHHSFPVGVGDIGAVAVDDKGVEVVVFVGVEFCQSILIVFGIDDCQLLGQPLERNVGPEDTCQRVFLVVERLYERAYVVATTDLIIVGR